jgi:tRNA(His) 5'-end guanylyltransferase
MEPKSFDAKMRELEYFHSLRILPGAWAIIRVDGRSFSRFTAERFEKHSARKATSILDRQSVSFKNELLFENGINFNDLPGWQRRGTGLYWEEYEKIGYNPKEQIEVKATRRRIKIDRELPMKDEYRTLIRQIVDLHSTD